MTEMILIDKAKVQQAMEALEEATTFAGAWPNGRRAITALRTAIEQAETVQGQEPESFEQWNAKQHGDPEEIGFLQALRIAYCAGQDSVTNATPPAAAPVQEPVAIVSGYYGGQCVVLPTNPAQLFNSGTAFYTTPPAQEFVCSTGLCHYRKPLTDDLYRAIESMIESHEAGDLDGWEVQLVKRRLREAAHGITGETK